MHKYHYDRKSFRELSSHTSRSCDRATSAEVHQVSKVSELIPTGTRVRDRWSTNVSTTNVKEQANRTLLTKLNIQLGANIMHPCGRVENYQQQCGDQAEPRPEHGGMFQQHGATAQLTPSLFACSLCSWKIKKGKGKWRSDGTKPPLSA